MSQSPDAAANPELLMHMRVDLKVLALQYEGDDHLVPSMIPRESSAMDFAKVNFLFAKVFRALRESLVL